MHNIKRNYQVTKHHRMVLLVGLTV